MSVTINGKSYCNVSGTVSINNDKITVDGVDIEDFQRLDCKEINIVIQGNVDKLQLEDGEVTINGDVNSLDSIYCNVQCWDVHGSINTRNGDIYCVNVQGNVETRYGAISLSE